MPTRRTFKSALAKIRKSQKLSLLELGLKIDSDASHVFKLEHGKDVTLSTMLRLADALGTTVTFGGFTLSPDEVTKKRPRKK